MPVKRILLALGLTTFMIGAPVLLVLAVVKTLGAC